MKKVTNLENKITIKLIIIAISLIGLTILMFVAKKGIETLSPYIYAVIVAISVIVGLYYVKSLMPFKKENQIKKCYETCDYLVIFTVSCLVIQFIFITIVFSAKVDGSSMFPNLYDGDSLLVKVIDESEIDNFDVVVAIYDDRDNNNMLEDETLLVKRVIGKPGDTFYYQNGILYLNGKEISEDYLKDEHGFIFNPTTNRNNPNITDFANREGIIFDAKTNQYIIQEGYYFLMGDNRDVSIDSRSVGLFKANQIVGEVKYRMITLFKWEAIS